jgi:hypothetical protein
MGRNHPKVGRYRTPDQKVAEQQRIAHYLARGLEQYQIRPLIEQEFAVTRTKMMISRDVQEIRARWWTALQRDLDQWIVEKLAELRALKQEYWQAWFESKGTQQSTLRSQGQSGDQGVMQAQVREEFSPGNPAYLAGVQRCLEEECRLLGLHAPLQIEPFVRWEAERIAKEYGLHVADVLREAEEILRGRG